MRNDLNWTARCPMCERMVFAADAYPEFAKDFSNEIAAFIRKGYIVGKETTAVVRAADWGCRCKADAP